ncbi:hypothetical protein RZS08_50525, partial [Arthrospira platensis SPKY1]|nr:hypothetical protein [Arthrospira platensis SPKY1]
VNGESAPGEGEWADAMMALGLSAAPSPAALSVALLLPPAADEAPEAVAKFLSGLRQSRVEVAGLLTSPGLNWAQESGPPRILAAVELPPGTPGYLAGEVLAAR